MMRLAVITSLVDMIKQSQCETVKSENQKKGRTKTQLGQSVLDNGGTLTVMVLCT